MFNQVVEEMDSPSGVSQDELDKLGRRLGRWFKEGEKDALCGLCRGFSDIPREFRCIYHRGHSYGMWIREAG